MNEARKYSAKNRCPDDLPYDNSRVILSSVEPDYINASIIKVCMDVLKNIDELRRDSFIFLCFRFRTRPQRTSS